MRAGSMWDHVSDKALCILLIVLLGWAGVAWVGASDDLLVTRSPSPYVHIITLYDAAGRAIDPRDANAPPYSPRATCGKCHDYGVISMGWHFNAMLGYSAKNPADPHGRPGEPWFHVDAATSTVLPISYRDWPGVRDPAALGYSPWGFVQRFGRHIPGGGPGELIDADDPEAHWAQAGPLEIDCMACHSATLRHDQVARARQIEEFNYQWIPTVALGLGIVRGSVREGATAGAVAEPIDDLAAFDPALEDAGAVAGSPVELLYDLREFDQNDRVFFDVRRRPLNERCTYCHVPLDLRPGLTPREPVHEDVHVAAGIQCADCHRNGLDHAMIRGYEDEISVGDSAGASPLTCRGCHYGEADATATELQLGGHYAAPRPRHRGFPEVHFEVLTCTACHSGPWPRPHTTHVQTAQAHGLGLPDRTHHDARPPLIQQPVLMDRGDEVIGPHRLLWPIQDGAPTGEGSDGEPRPHAWPLAHNVRPAAQSVGARGCDDCHAVDSAFLFGEVAFASPLTGEALGEPFAQIHFMGLSPTLQKLWGLGFAARPLYKWLSFVLAGALAAVVCARLLAWINGSPAPVRAAGTRLDHRLGDLGFGAWALLLVCGALLGLSGYVAWLFFGRLGEIPLMLHTALGLAFIALALAVAVLWRREAETAEHRTRRLERPLLWLMLGLAAVVAWSMLVNLLPVLTPEQQAVTIAVHRWSGLGFVLAAAGHAYLRLARR